MEVPASREDIEVGDVDRAVFIAVDVEAMEESIPLAEGNVDVAKDDAGVTEDDVALVVE